MKQKKVDIKLEWGEATEGSSLPQRVVVLQSHAETKPEWRTTLDETEFLEFAELIYVEYCHIRRRMGVHNQPNVGISGNAYFISLQMYSELLPKSFGEEQTAALRRLLSVSGSREDLMLTKRLCAWSGQHGYMAMIEIVLEEGR